MDGPALTASQVELLRLVENSAGIGVSAAARALHLAGNSVSTLVNQLTEAGYLRRETDPQDRRAVRLYLTDAATTRLTSWRSARAELVGTGLAALPAADREAIVQALPALRRLTEALAEENT
ncbi:MarR family transcriptional regulator [Planosporangium thailandense]|uniref:MarR family transcriptional regulator n=2 Tax=Planosporangium thailandense TaxID=765197 RepID=A0ABX0Y9K0_9ACTN|nr:MarR family transcriptional regulator [Planosporangium thailandense]NJC73899.1 MarR family transcriptional regulator [Planosporangium thailandense]